MGIQYVYFRKTWSAPYQNTNYLMDMALARLMGQVSRIGKTYQIKSLLQY